MKVAGGGGGGEAGLGGISTKGKETKIRTCNKGVLDRIVYENYETYAN